MDRNQNQSQIAIRTQTSYSLPLPFRNLINKLMAFLLLSALLLTPCCINWSLLLRTFRWPPHDLSVQLL